MNAVRLFFAAATVGAWVVGAAVLFTAIWVIARAGRWTYRLAAAALWWRRDTHTEPTGSSIDDAELADWLAIETAKYRNETREEDR